MSWDNTDLDKDVELASRRMKTTPGLCHRRLAEILIHGTTGGNFEDCARGSEYIMKLRLEYFNLDKMASSWYLTHHTPPQVNTLHIT